jgi:hypothetical protein
LAIGLRIPNSAHKSAATLYQLHTAVGGGAVKKFGIYFQWRIEHFKARMLFFSVDQGK